MEPLSSLLIHGGAFFCVTATVAVVLAVAWVQLRLRRLARRDGRFAAQLGEGNCALVSGQRVKLRGRLAQTGEPACRHEDGAPTAVASLLAHPERDRAGLPEAGGSWLSVSAEGLRLIVDDPAVTVVELLGPVQVVAGSLEFRSSTRLRAIPDVRARVAMFHPADVAQMDLEYVVERSLGAGDPVVVCGQLTHAGETWTLAPAQTGVASPFRRMSAATAESAALLVGRIGPPIQVRTQMRRYLKVGLVALLAVFTGAGLVARAALDRLQFVAPSEAHDGQYHREVALAGLSPLHRKEALGKLSSRYRGRVPASEATIDRATEIDRLAGCEVAVQALATGHPERAAVVAEDCPAAIGAAEAWYALGELDRAFAAASASASARLFAPRDFALELALLTSHDAEAAELVARDEHGRYRARVLAIDPTDPTAEAQVTVLLGDDAPTSRWDLAAIARIPDPTRRLALLDRGLPQAMGPDAITLWYLLRGEIDPERAWPATSCVRTSTPDANGDRSEWVCQRDDHQAPSQRIDDRYRPYDPGPGAESAGVAPPLHAAMTFLEFAGQPTHDRSAWPGPTLPPYPWGLVFRVAEQLERQPGHANPGPEGLRLAVRVTHVAGEFELLAGEYGEARRWFTRTGDACARLEGPQRPDVAEVCRRLPRSWAFSTLLSGGRMDDDPELAAVLRWLGDASGPSPMADDPGLAAVVRWLHEPDAPSPVLGDGFWTAVRDGDGLAARQSLHPSSSLHHPAARLAGARVVEDRAALVDHLLWTRAPEMCMHRFDHGLLPDTVARAETLAALGEAEAAAKLRARARVLRALLQRRDGVVERWAERGYMRCLSPPGSAVQ